MFVLIVGVIREREEHSNMETSDSGQAANWGDMLGRVKVFTLLVQGMYTCSLSAVSKQITHHACMKICTRNEQTNEVAAI